MFGGYPPTAIGYPPTAIGYTPTAIGYPPTAIGCPPTAISCPPTAIGCPPTAIGCPPTAIGCPPTAIGYPPTAISYPPAAIIGRIGHSEFFFFFLLRQPRQAVYKRLGDPQARDMHKVAVRRLIIPIIPGGGIFSPVPPVTEPCFPEGWFPVGTFDEPQLGCAAMARATQRAQAGCQNGFRTPPHNPQSQSRSDSAVQFVKAVS